MKYLDSHLPDLIRERGILARKIQQETAELQRYDRVIAEIQGKIVEGQKPPLQQFPSVKPDRYKGKPPVDAAEEYLKDNSGLPVPLSQIVEVLVTGGADHGQPRRGQDSPDGLISQTLRIGIPNKPEIFDWEPKVPSKRPDRPKMPLSKKIPNDKVIVWLAPTAYMPKKRKRTATRKDLLR